MPTEMLQATSDINLVTGLVRFADRLHRPPAVEVHADVIADEQHATVWPSAVTRGLVHLYRTDRP